MTENQVIASSLWKLKLIWIVNPGLVHNSTRSWRLTCFPPSALLTVIKSYKNEDHDTIKITIYMWDVKLKQWFWPLGYQWERSTTACGLRWEHSMLKSPVDRCEYQCQTCVWLGSVCAPNYEEWTKWSLMNRIQPWRPDDNPSVWGSLCLSTILE